MKCIFVAYLGLHFDREFQFLDIENIKQNFRSSIYMYILKIIVIDQGNTVIQMKKHSSVQYRRNAVWYS